MSGNLRPLTIFESFRLIELGCQIEREIDAELGELFLRPAGGDDGVISDIHDRCNVIGRFDIADGIRIPTLISGKPFFDLQTEAE